MNLWCIFLVLYRGHLLVKISKLSQSQLSQFCFDKVRHDFNFLITLQGLPAAIQSVGMLLVTILPAPMILLAPIVTPFRIMQWAPIQASSSIVIGVDLVPMLLSRRAKKSMGCASVSVIRTHPPIFTLLPIEMWSCIHILVLLIPTLLPMVSEAPFSR